jgi:predicted DNA-binding WGR domain protein
MIVLRRSDPSRNMARFYELSLQRSLFGETLLVRRWGRIGTYGRRREVWFEEPAAAADELERLAARKIRRGYFRVVPVAVAG